MRTPLLVMVFLLTFCFSLVTWLKPALARHLPDTARAESLLGTALGDSRRLFATHCFFKADRYLHSGFYPTLFDDRTLLAEKHLAGPHDDHDDAADNPAHRRQAQPTPDAELGYGFLGPPRDWLDRLGRYFFPSRHTHLEGKAEAGELVPWLRVAAALDPHRIETYLVTAYWLRRHLEQPEAALQILREGWRANPESYEILFELGRSFEEDRQDPVRARNLYELSLRKWEKRQDGVREADSQTYALLVAHLARLAEQEGRSAEAIGYFERLEKVSPDPARIRERLDELRRSR
ncbi:MAG: hypothetical protein FJ387_14045 [Verrucomicrobia bacterium]|nr:hypothetical protein [Verrucomicrobiota bacterium]